MRRNSGTWMAFLAMTFAVVGMIGLFATYAAPLPYQRMAARNVALDAALASGGNKDALESLRVQLDDSAATVIEGAGALPDRVAAARAAMQAELERDADAVAFRLRLEMIVVTIVAAGFGLVILGAASRGGG